MHAFTFSKGRSAIALLVGLLVSALAILSMGTPAQAAPTRNDSQNEPLYLVHGFDLVGTAGHNCSTYWGAAVTKFKSLGWTGAIRTVKYYAGDTNCNTSIASGTQDTSINDYGRALAWDIYNRDSKYGRSVDIVAHSMGGLVARAAITGVAKKSAGWPPYIYVEDVVTIGTPHNGTGIARACSWKNCVEMRPGSDFLASLNRNAQAAGGTDWTMIGTEDDDVVPVASATTESGGAGHYIWYYSGQPLEHSQQTSNVSGTYRNRYWNYQTKTWIYQAAGANIITSAKNAAFSWSKW